MALTRPEGVLLADILLIGFCWLAKAFLLPVLAHFLLLIAIGFAIVRVRTVVGPLSRPVFSQLTTI